MAHISDSHPSSEKVLSFGQINDVSPPTKFMAAARCPFCNELDLSGRNPGLSKSQDADPDQSLVGIDFYQRHLSCHMEQLALLAKSASVEDDEVSDNSDAEKLSQAASSDMTQSSIDPKMADLTVSEGFDAASGSPVDHTRTADSAWDFDPGVAPLQQTLSNHSEEENVVDTADSRHAFESTLSISREDPTDLGSRPRDVPHYISHESRGRRLNDGPVDEARLERRYRAHSRGRRETSSTDSRGRSDYYRHEWNDMEREAQEREEREWAEFERRRREKLDKEEAQNRKLKADVQKFLDDVKTKVADDEAREAERQRIVRDYERKQREVDEKVNAEEISMRKRLAESGFTQSQIDAIMNKEKVKKQWPAITRRNSITGTTASLRGATYSKVHVDHLSTETLRYYDIPWEYDRVSTLMSSSTAFTSIEYTNRIL